MARLIFVSGPCGCGKSTFADKYARHLVNKERKSVYVIHGDDFHQGFVEPEDKGDFFVNGQASDIVQWEEILQFNWDCIISTAERVLKKGLDVVIDYVIETEFERVRDLASRYNADFYYIVLTASERIRDRKKNPCPRRCGFDRKVTFPEKGTGGHAGESWTFT